MITRKCDSCGETINTDKFIELSARELETNGSNGQDSRNEYYGDYCSKCIVNGDAMKDLISDVNNKNGERNKK